MCAWKDAHTRMVPKGGSHAIYGYDVISIMVVSSITTVIAPNVTPFSNRTNIIARFCRKSIDQNEQYRTRAYSILHSQYFFLNMTITRGGYITLDFGLILVPFNIAIIAFPADVTSYYDWDERDIL